MIWNRLAIFATIFPASASAATLRDTVRRWRKAHGADPDLAADLIRLGGVMTLSPPTIGANAATPEQLAYEAGRRDFAVQLLSMMQLTPYELTKMMEDPDA